MQRHPALTRKLGLGGRNVVEVGGYSQSASWRAGRQPTAHREIPLSLDTLSGCCGQLLGSSSGVSCGSWSQQQSPPPVMGHGRTDCIRRLGVVSLSHIPLLRGRSCGRSVLLYWAISGGATHDP